MGRAFDAAPAARLLIETTNGGGLIDALPEAYRPATLEDGYDVQDAYVAATGDKVVGWKLGQGSPRGMRAAKLERPLMGRVLAKRVHPGGATIRLARNGPVTVEIEIAFRLAREVTPMSPVLSTRELVGSVHLASEVILSRYADRRAVGLPSYLAENVGFEALVVGGEIGAEEIASVSSSVEVTCNGNRAGGAQTGDDAIDSWRALDYLVAHARSRGLTLAKGDIVTTGTISNPFDAGGPEATVVAKAGGHTLQFGLRWP